MKLSEYRMPPLKSYKFASEFDWEAFSNRELAVKCYTLREAANFQEAAFKQGHTWASGSQKAINLAVFKPVTIACKPDHVKMQFSNSDYFYYLPNVDWKEYMHETV